MFLNVFLATVMICVLMFTFKKLTFWYVNYILCTFCSLLMSTLNTPQVGAFSADGASDKGLFF